MFEKFKTSIKKVFRGDSYVCTKYEKQEYYAPIAKDFDSLPYTEVIPKTRKCIEWEKLGKGATGQKCTKYEYINTSKQELESKYKKVKRYRMVCVEGYYEK